ncbi:beta-1,3-glucan-binding protein-like [Littorina saxatilis]|uniref:beta-1,3-glucan-binding protein-like n=1 Tax=Littorina saxatilis TaxID=31220 RepID=UPI0038B65726
MWSSTTCRIGVDGHTSLTVNTPSQGFWNEAHLQGNNIWAHGGKSAPFHRPFYLILNVAVGGDFFWGGFDNSPYPRPWSTGPNDYYEFWQNRHLWLPTWHGEDVAMKVKSVKMMQY